MVAASSPSSAVSAARNWSIYSRSSQLTSEGYKMFLDLRLESLKPKTYFNQVKFLPPKREAFHERGGFCSERSEYQKRLTSSEALDGPRTPLLGFERESLSLCAHLGHPAVHCALSSAAQCPGPCRQQQDPHGKERNSFCQTASAWSRHSGMDSLSGTPECNLEILRRWSCMDPCFPT